MKRLLLTITLPAVFLMTAFSQSPQPTAPDSVTWYPMEKAQQLAQKNDMKVLVYAMAEWCGYCKKMEREVYPRQAVINTLMKYYYPVKLDIESDNSITFNKETMTERRFARKFRVSGTPTFFFISGEGEIIGAQPGYIPANTFNTLLTYVGTDAYQEVEFEEYMEQEESNSEGS